jgi:AraC family transcriptional regulator
MERFVVAALNDTGRPKVTIEAQLHTPSATAQIVRFDMLEPIDRVKMNSDRFWIDLCLTPRPADARACYPNRWGPHRFERLGELLVVPPGEVMHARTQAGNQTSVVCEIDASLIANWCDGDLKWTSLRLEAGLRISDWSIRGLLMRLTRELGRPGFASEMLVELVVNQIAIELARCCGSLGQGRINSRLAAWRVRRIEERANELGKAPSLEELGELCGLSVRQLSRGFRASRGCSIGEFVAQTRVENAKRLLIDGRSVKVVAYALGFSSPQSFSFAFRRATGLCPAEYQHLAC